MAMADYCLCVMCGCKAFYDAEVNYGEAEVLALCKECARHHILTVHVKHAQSTHPAPEVERE